MAEQLCLPSACRAGTLLDPMSPNVSPNVSSVACPHCGGAPRGTPWDLTDRLFRTTAKRFLVHRCGNCALRYLAPVPPFSELAGYYPKTYWTGPSDRTEGKGLHGRLTEFYRRTMLFDHARFVRHVASDQRARGLTPHWLDIGCGDGSVLETVGVRPCVGLDTSKDALRQVLARGIPAVNGWVTQAPLREGTFSIVSMFHVLEHVEDPVAFLSGAGKLVGPGGSLVVQVPNARSIQAWMMGRKWAGYDVPRHLIHFTPRHLRETAERAGFQVVRQTQLSVRDNPTTLVNSVFPRLYPLARANQPSMLRDLTYLALTLLAIPPTFLGALCGLGATVMIEARRPSG